MSASAAHPEDGKDAGPAIAAARKTSGLTQRELSRQAAVSLSLLRKIEQGTRPLTPGVRTALSTVLGPMPTEGESVSAAERITRALPRLSQTMDVYDIPPDPPPAPRPLSELRRMTGLATTWRLASEYSQLAGLLPGLITDLTAAALADTGHEQGQAFGLLALAYRAADAIADKHGHHDMSARATELIRWAAARSADPLLEMMSAYVRAELAHAGIPSEAADRMAEARAVAQQVPDGVYCGTAFGPGSVRIHELALAVESGDVSHAITLADWWQPPHALPAERRSHFHIEAARAYCWAGHRDRAVAALWQARRAAPQHTRCSPAVDETVRILIRGSRKPPPSLLQLAAWIGHA
jgi:transcriptional regulator with XRE-family HTH domain